MIISTTTSNAHDNDNDNNATTHPTHKEGEGGRIGGGWLLTNIPGSEVTVILGNVNVDTVSGNLMGLRQGQSVANPSPTRRSVGSHICIKRGRLSPQQFLVD